MHNFTVKEKEVIFECLRASIDGPFFDDDDFNIIFGLERNEVQEIVAKLPIIDMLDHRVQRAINNSMNNLLGFPHKKEAYWSDFISVTPTELEKIYAKWKENR